MSRTARNAALNALGIVAALFFAFPVYWMAVSALKQPNDIQTYVPVFVPIPTLDNFAHALAVPHMTDYLTNSVLVTLTTVVAAITVGFLAAATVSRVKLRGGRGFLVLVAIAQMAPAEALLIPYFLTMRDASLDNSLLSVVIIYFVFTLPFTIWSLRGFVAGIPVDLEEAAMVDGASRLGAFLRVELPLLAPGLVATSIFCFITAWNEFLFANALLRDETIKTLPIWLVSFRTQFGTDWGATMAASTLFTIPVLVFFLLVQDRMVGGMTSGAVKG